MQCRGQKDRKLLKNLYTSYEQNAIQNEPKTRNLNDCFVIFAYL